MAGPTGTWTAESLSPRCSPRARRRWTRWCWPATSWMKSTAAQCATPPAGRWGTGGGWHVLPSASSTLSSLCLAPSFPAGRGAGAEAEGPAAELPRAAVAGARWRGLCAPAALPEGPEGERAPLPAPAPPPAPGREGDEEGAGGQVGTVGGLRRGCEHLPWQKAAGGCAGSSSPQAALQREVPGPERRWDGEETGRDVPVGYLVGFFLSAGGVIPIPSFLLCFSLVARRCWSGPSPPCWRGAQHHG